MTNFTFLNKEKYSKSIKTFLLMFIMLGSGYVLGENNILSNFNIEKVFANERTVVLNNNLSTSTIAEVDFNNFKILREVKEIIGSKFISWKATYTPPTTKEVEQSIVAGFVSSLKDPYTQYFPPVQAKIFEDNVKGSFGGVGMEVGEKDGNINVIAPLKDSPAEKAGLKSGDIVMKVDSTDIINMSTEQAVSVIRGDVGTEVNIKIFRPSEKVEKEFKIKRDTIKIPTLKTEVKNGIFVIHLYNFSADSAELFRKALIEFSEKKNIDKMLIDLRGNPGGYLEASVNIASFFLDEGKIIVSEKGNASYGNVDHRAKPYKAFNDNLKLYVLVDGGSASASEILAGALQDHKVAKVYGQKTYGKGSVQEYINLNTEGALKVTIANWFTPNGKSITENKIVPDVLLERTSTTTADMELDSVVKLILKK